MGNTGYKKFLTLREYYVGTNIPTGRTKANVSTDPNYVAPVIDLAACHVPPAPVIPQRNVKVVMPVSGCTITVKKGNFSVSTSLSGTWQIPDYTYDSVTFAVTGYMFGTLQLQVVRGGNVIYYNITDNWTVEVPGSFSGITELNIL